MKCRLQLHILCPASRWTCGLRGEVPSRNRGRIEDGLQVRAESAFMTPIGETLKVIPSRITSLKASRSSGYFATGLQKLCDWPAQSSTVRSRWCAVMVHATVSPRLLTASMAARVVACSRTMRRRGNALCRATRCGKNLGSALRTQMFWNGKL